MRSVRVKKISYKQQESNNKLDEFDQAKLKEARKPANIMKMIKIYNCLCNNCRNLMKKDTKRPMSDYCNTCQENMEKIWSK